MNRCSVCNMRLKCSTLKGSICPKRTPNLFSLTDKDLEYNEFGKRLEKENLSLLKKILQGD